MGPWARLLPRSVGQPSGGRRLLSGAVLRLGCPLILVARGGRPGPFRVVLLAEDVSDDGCGLANAQLRTGFCGYRSGGAIWGAAQREQHAR